MSLPHQWLDRLALLLLVSLTLPSSLTMAGDPSVASIRPADGSIYYSVFQFFEATLVNGDTANIANASLQLDGSAVISQFVKTTTGATVTYREYFPNFAPGSSHTFTLFFTDTATPAVTRTQAVTFQVGYAPFRTHNYFIEAEDFNFGRGQTISDQPIGMGGPYLGGAFQDKGNGLLGANCDGSDFGVDYFDGDSINQQATYRANTAVEIDSGNGSSGVNRGDFDVQVNHVVTWSSAGEWMNYTRTFPTYPHVYKVYARMSQGDSTKRRGGALYKVTSDASDCNQTLRQLGTFSAPWTGGWDIWPAAGTEQDAFILMTTGHGDNWVTLAGKTTLRWQFEEGAGDLDYLVFVDQDLIIDYFPRIDVTQPSERSADPMGALDASVGGQDEFFFVKSATVKLDGVVVPAEIKNLGSKTTFRYTPLKPFVLGSWHQYEIAWLDSFGDRRTFTLPFQITFTPIPLGTLFIEAEDFNFGHGQTITNTPVGMSGPYRGGDFYEKGDGVGGFACDGSDFGVDYYDGDSINQQAVYRANTAVEAAKRNGPEGLNRGSFQVQVNQVVGWTAAGEWMNYTRTFPATVLNRYKVYARMAHGSPESRRGGKLYEVMGASGDDCNQLTTLLGTFSAPWTGGWDTWPDAGTEQDALISLQLPSGSPDVYIRPGVRTLRFEFAEDAGDLDYIAFVPSELDEPPDISISPTGGVTFKGLLESSETVPGNFTPVEGATSPYFPPPTRSGFSSAFDGS